jgi:biopolymer transport protein ExbD
MSFRKPPSDDAKPNLTPMIDMTFLLVVFFMITIDLSQKEFQNVALPFAKNGVEDITDTEGPKRLVINLLASGDIVFKSYEGKLATGTPAEQADALVRLKDELALLTSGVGTREEDGASKIPVMIHGDRSARWQYVQWIMQICADPRIAIYKIQFAVKGEDPQNE